MSKTTVLKRYPKAFAYHWRDCWAVYLPYGRDLAGNHSLGSGRTAAQAWKEAAESAWCSAPNKSSTLHDRVSQNAPL